MLGQLTKCIRTDFVASKELAGIVYIPGYWVGSMLQIQGNEISFSSSVQVRFCRFKFFTNKVL